MTERKKNDQARHRVKNFTKLLRHLLITVLNGNLH